MNRRCFASVLGVFYLLSLSSCGRGQHSIAGLDNFHADVMQTTLMVSFVSETLHLDQGLTIPLPFIQGSTVSVAPDISSKGTVFQFAVNLVDLFQQIHQGAQMGLPDGRDLPDITGGKLSSWPARIGNVHLQIYLSSDVFGFYVPLKFLQAIPEILSQEIDDSRGNRLGKVYAIPPGQSGDGSGLLVLLPFVGGAQSSLD